MLDPFVDGRGGDGGRRAGARLCAGARGAAGRHRARLQQGDEGAATRPRRRPSSSAGPPGAAPSAATTAPAATPRSSAATISPRSTAGVAAGLDYHFSRDAVFGFALAGGGTNWSLADGLGGGKSDAFQAGVYAAARSGPAYLAASLAFAHHWMSTDRFAAFGNHLTAGFNAQSIGARVESGYRVGTPAGAITPYAALQAQSFHTPDLQRDRRRRRRLRAHLQHPHRDDIRSELGARFDHVALVDPTAVLTLRSRLAWAHGWVSDPSLAAAFQALPGASFIVNGAAPAKDSALASAGAELKLANGVTLAAKLDGEFASRAQTYTGTGTVRWAGSNAPAILGVVQQIHHRGNYKATTAGYLYRGANRRLIEARPLPPASDHIRTRDGGSAGIAHGVGRCARSNGVCERAPTSFRRLGRSRALRTASGRRRHQPAKTGVCALVASRATVLLASVLISVAVSARAQDATWLANPGSGDFNDAPNWSTGAVPTGTAFFDTSNTTNLSFVSLGQHHDRRMDIQCRGIELQLHQYPDFSIQRRRHRHRRRQRHHHQRPPLEFLDTSTAGTATITNSFGGLLSFTDSSTAGGASITTNSGSQTRFSANSTAGNATIIANSGALTQFFDNSTAANATISNNGVLNFFDASTAGNAAIANLAASNIVNFFNSSTAGNASITNNGFLGFSDTSTAGNASITNTFFVGFSNASSAGTATITNNLAGTLAFGDSSTAANATITMNNGGRVVFTQDSTGGQARFITNGGGVFDMSGLTGAGMTAGSIEGAGSYALGSKQLTVGGNNLSTQVSGIIADGGTFGGTGGSLVKVGAGTLTLSGVNTYTGATTVNAGTLRVNGSIASSIITNNNANLEFFGASTAGSAAITNNSLLQNSATQARPAAPPSPTTALCNSATTARPARHHHQQQRSAIPRHQHGRQRHHHQQRQPGVLQFLGTSTAGTPPSPTTALCNSATPARPAAPHRQQRLCCTSPKPARPAPPPSPTTPLLNYDSSAPARPAAPPSPTTALRISSITARPAPPASPATAL